MNIIIIYIIFLFSFFGNSLTKNHLMPPEITLLQETLIYFIFLYSMILANIKKKGYVLHLSYTFIIFLFITIGSMIVNNYYNSKVIFSMRLLWRFYIFYIALINLNLQENELKKINNFVALLFILEIPFVAGQFFYHGRIVETNFGSFYEGGSATTMYSITALMYLAGYFSLYKPKLSYLLLGLGFIGWSIAGMKRAVLFLFPISLIGMYYLIYIKGKSINLIKHIFIVSFIIISSLTISIVILKTNYTLNPDRMVGGKVDLHFALNYTKNYNMSVNPDDPSVTTGRLSTTLNAFETLKDSGVSIFLFGFGPGCFTTSLLSSYPDMRIINFAKGYGVTPMIYIALEYGIMGVIIYGIIITSFLRMCWNYYLIESNAYWKAFAVGSLGTAFFMIFLFCGYNYISIMGDSYPLFYFYIMGVIFVRMKNISNDAKLSSKQIVAV